MNVIHGADSVQNSARETALWFSDDDIAQWEPALQKWIVDPALIQWICVCLFTWTWVQAQACLHGGLHRNPQVLPQDRMNYSQRTFVFCVWMTWINIKRLHTCINIDDQY